MPHAIHKITAFHFTNDYSLEITFEDNTSKTIDFSPILYGEVFGALKDPDYFKRVSLDTEVGTIVWPNGADFDPSLLYNWEQHIEELSVRARKWDLQEV